MLVSQTERRIEVQRRNTAGYWELHEYGAGQLVRLESLSVTLSVDALYRDPLNPQT